MRGAYSMKNWKYYKHAAVPRTGPHEKVDLTPIDDASIWEMDGKPLFARWTSDFDCGYETNWWYCIKDVPFDLSLIKSNYRYKVNKGLKYFDIQTIDPVKYCGEIYDVFTAAYSSWPAKYRPFFSHDDAVELSHKLAIYPDMVCYGVFNRETGELSGFMQAPTFESYAELQVLRVKPECEKHQINAALVYALLKSNQSRLENGYYILDGARNINHETNFQDYLEKYFGFRKAYCNLHIAYNPKIKWLIKMMFPLRKILQTLDAVGLIHQINSVLFMEELVRNEARNK